MTVRGSCPGIVRGVDSRRERSQDAGSQAKLRWGGRVKMGHPFQLPGAGQLTSNEGYGLNTLTDAVIKVFPD